MLLQSMMMEMGDSDGEDEVNGWDLGVAEEKRREEEDAQCEFGFLLEF